MHGRVFQPYVYTHVVILPLGGEFGGDSLDPLNKCFYALILPKFSRTQSHSKILVLSSGAKFLHVIVFSWFYLCFYVSFLFILLTKK